MQYLVINNSKNGIYSVADQYSLFNDRDAAIEHFKTIGWTDDWGMGVSDKPGIASMLKCGLIDIMFIPIVAE